MTTLKSRGTKRLIEVYHAVRQTPQGGLKPDFSTTAETPERAMQWAEENDRMPHLAQLDSPVISVVKDQIWIDLRRVR